MTRIILLPILFQACLAVILLFFWTKIRFQKIISITGSVLGVVIAAQLFYSVYSGTTIAVQAGNWVAPFGISFVADLFASGLVLLTSLVSLAVTLYATATIARDRIRFGYFPIYHFLIMGLNGAFLTGDVFNLYVWFEIIIISSFVLITLGSERKQLEGAVKYFALNMLASMLFLTGLGILYGLAGTLNMADLAGKVAAIDNRTLVDVCALFFLIGFGIKAAIFPMYFWLPDSYHTPPAAISAIFGGLLTKVGVYALIRVFTLIFVPDAFLSQLFIILAALTILSGGIGALVQKNLRQVFSYLLICHIGYMIMGLGLFTEIAILGAVFYLIHDIIIKTNLYLISGLIYKIKGTEKLRLLGDLYADWPRLSLLMAVSLFSLVGIPPLSGFWPKLSLILAGIRSDNYFSVAAILFGSFITLMVVVKIWSQVFWKTAPSAKPKDNFEYFKAMSSKRKMLMVGSITILTGVTLFIGFGAEFIQEVSGRVAAELMHPTGYIQTVLGK